jgi:hypothetical protein
MDKTSCISREPLTKLDEHGTASILNYNLPQSTAYDVISFIRLEIPEKLFKDSAKKPTPNNYWDRLDEQREKLDLTPQRIGGVLRGQSYTSLTEVMDTGLNFTAEEIPTSSGVKLKAANLTVSTKTASFATEYAANKIAEGFRPQLVRRASGKQGLIFQPRPKKANPAIYLVLRMKMASYLGDYGAGQTLSTFSLLPGEKTTIQVRDYRHNETTKATSQSVLDSYSESAMEDGKPAACRFWPTPKPSIKCAMRSMCTSATFPTTRGRASASSRRSPKRRTTASSPTNATSP